MGVTRGGSMQSRSPVIPVHSTEYWFNGQPAGANPGLAADSTGVKTPGRTNFVLSGDLLAQYLSIILRVSKTSSAGDEVTEAQLYNVTTSTVVGSVSVTGGIARKEAAITAAITAGDTYTIRWVVTTASATTGATFDAESATLVLTKQES